MSRPEITRAEGEARPGQCVGKDAHPSAQQAKKVVRNMKRFGKTVIAYRCPLCHDWHVGRPSRVR